jgi:CheY-specific phosphatase CheX
VSQQPKIEYINPFIKSTIQSMKSMVYTDCKRVGLFIKDPAKRYANGDISVMVSIFGTLKGVVVITFPRKLTIHLVSAMLMDDTIDDFDDDVNDGIAEIGNLVAGTAKSEIVQAFGGTSTISIPTIITGGNHSVHHHKKVPCIGCVFETPKGKFSVEVALTTEEETT